MTRARDPLANIERMRRELGELFDDVWTRTGISPRQRVGFLPRVDVYYSGDPPKIVVKADLAGVKIEDVNLELKGRTLIISGKRRPGDTEGREYQQIEIEHGPFLREVALGVDVDPEQAHARYEDGILRVALPLATAVSEPRKVPISGTAEREDDRS